MKQGTVLLGRYVVERGVARGGMGSLFVARHQQLGHPVAIKVLDAVGAHAAEDRFLLEARAMATIRSPYVVQVIDFGRHQDRPLIVMEFLEGHSLADRLDQTQVLTWNYAFSMAAQVAEGLAAMHRKSVLHRDIKPGNIMLCAGRPEVAKIVDFGIAKPTGDLGPKLTRAGMVVGTPAYMAPEQMLGSQVGPGTDLYALGITLWEALCGGLPFGEEFHEATARLASEAPPPVVPVGLPPLPSAAQQLVSELLLRDPTQRPQDAGAVAARLRTVATGGPATAPPSLAAPATVDAPAAIETGPLLCAARLPAAALRDASEREWLAQQIAPTARSYSLADVWIALEPPPEDERGDANRRAAELTTRLTARYGPTVRVMVRIAPIDFALTPSVLAGVGRLPPALASLLQEL